MDTWKENNLSVYTVYATSVDLGEKRPGYGLQEMYLKFQLALQRSTSQLLLALDNSSLDLFLFERVGRHFLGSCPAAMLPASTQNIKRK